jgi:hypothetical protein
MNLVECVRIHKSWENALEFLNECKCCERHKIDKPKKDKKWYDRGSPKKNLNYYQLSDHRDWRNYIKYCMPCECNCRNLAREIVREYKIPIKERCPVRDELHFKFKSIIENTIECSICFSDFNNCKLITTLDQCGHTFCKSCITKWFGNNGQVECPLCRTISWSNTLHTGTWNQICEVYI